jgi:hypothetical protein
MATSAQQSKMDRRIMANSCGLVGHIGVRAHVGDRLAEALTAAIAAVGALLASVTVIGQVAAFSDRIVAASSYGEQQAERSQEELGGHEDLGGLSCYGCW